MICVEVHSNNVLTVRDNTFSNAVSDSIKHETVKFLYSDNWKDYQKTAVFSVDGAEPVNIVLDGQNSLCVAENECYIPFEALKGDRFELSVFGIKGDSLATTTQVQIEVLKSGYALGNAPQEPTADQYSQIIEIMTAAKDIAQSVRNDADAGVFNGKDGKDGKDGEKGEKGDKGEQGPPVPLDEIYTEIANASVQNTVSGKSLKLDDVYAIPHNCSCKLVSDKYEAVVGESNNILQCNSDTLIINGLLGDLDGSFSYVIESDGSVIINGYTNAPANARFIMNNLTPGTTYTFSLRTSDETQLSKKEYEINFFQNDESGAMVENGYIYTANSDYLTFTVLDNVKTCEMHIGYWGRSEVDESGIRQEPFENLILYPQLELGTEMTDWEPCGAQIGQVDYISDFSSVKVKVTADGNTTEYTPMADGTLEGIKSMGSVMEVTTDNSYATITDFTYAMDIKKYIDKRLEQV